MPRLAIRRFGSILAVFAAAHAQSAASQTIDFETLPGGAPTTDLQFIDDEFETFGITFSLVDRDTGLPIGSPRIAKAGAPQTAFEGCLAPDTPRPNLGLGDTFLTDGTTVGETEGDLRVDYATPVAQASGVILDIDCRVGGGPPCEQWTITAYDSTGTELASVILDAPQGAPNPECASPGAGPGDAQAFGWSLDVAEPLIRAIVFRYTGTPATVGLAFDNFSVASLPGPPLVTALANADSACAGETVTLAAEVAAGLPPYSYLWQEEVGATWVDLGGESTQAIQPAATARYRVRVTDTIAQETTSAPVTVAATNSMLCDASLLVSCSTNGSVVRYGFQSHLTASLVLPHSGGLSTASDLACGGDGLLYVVEQNANRVLRYDAATGTFVDVFVTSGSGGLSVPVGIGFGPDGNLYVASFSSNSVLRYDGGTGAFLDVFAIGGLNGPTGLVFGPDEDLYVSSWNGDRIVRFDGATGSSLGDFVTAGSGGLDAPRGLTFGPDGNLYVAEQFHDSVSRYDGTTGAFLDVFVPSGNGIDRANDVVFGLDGALYVASFDNGQVLQFDGTTGAVLGALDDTLLSGPAWVVVGCSPIATSAPVQATPGVGLAVDPNVPNPFGPNTTIRFTLPSEGRTRVTIVDVTGRLVSTLLDASLSAGRHSAAWNGVASDGALVPSGIYFARIESAREQRCVKMVLVR